MGPSIRQALPGVTPPGVSYNGFLGAVWAGVAVSGLVLSCRLYSRHRGPRRLFWDDVFAIASFSLVLITGALLQWVAKDMYYVINVQAGLATFQPNFYERFRRWLQVALIVELFFHTSLILIKLSFLFFFRRLGNGIDYFRYIWWPVVALSLIFYVVSVGNVNYTCLVEPLDIILSKCNTPEEVNRTDRQLKANAALDVASDFLTMLLPAILLWNVRIPWTKKLALFGLFSLSIITMTIAIVRVASIGLTKRPDGQDDVSCLWLWSAIEPPVAIVVSCLSAFPQLFAQSHQKPSFTPSETYRRMMSGIRSGENRRQNSWMDITVKSQPGKSFQSTNGAPDLEFLTQNTQDSLLGVLTPNRITNQTHAEPPLLSSPSHDNGITREVGFSVTRQAA
ncbi:hypothetical protein SAMD00023353_1201770 [Rosellinia necatrix]|uniref:Rhodopsin domain-containing protein n=1 Tax=Rosellinia necatrix TaxID=77044 RepID=A0A1W2TKG7_ROSNE|nr:hypothetical protein SAMD00023353_1201770 [Rosellinia necatrix]